MRPYCLGSDLKIVQYLLYRMECPNQSSQNVLFPPYETGKILLFFLDIYMLGVIKTSCYWLLLYPTSYFCYYYRLICDYYKLLIKLTKHVSGLRCGRAPASYSDRPFARSVCISTRPGAPRQKTIFENQSISNRAIEIDVLKPTLPSFQVAIIIRSSIPRFWVQTRPILPVSIVAGVGKSLGSF